MARPQLEWDRAQAAGADLWVFGYGSLMWDPGIPFIESAWAVLRGYHRSLCILSVRNRGTWDRPGLALGLERGGACRGRAFRIATGDVDEACATLWAREMANRAYIPRLLPVRLDDGQQVPALVFLARPGHPQFAGGLAPETAARLVVQGTGSYGTALDYLRNVVVHLDGFGIADGPLHRILVLAEAMTGDEGAAGAGASTP